MLLKHKLLQIIRKIFMEMEKFPGSNVDEIKK